jgi:mycothiol system anti-sigma-R factor
MKQHRLYVKVIRNNKQLTAAQLFWLILAESRMHEDYIMNCMETVARLHLYIDRELSAEEIAIVHQHLKDCPSCECRFHFDMHLKRLVHEKCTIDKAPDHLRAAVMRLARTPDGGAEEIDPEVAMEIRADVKRSQQED